MLLTVRIVIVFFLVDKLEIIFLLFSYQLQHQMIISALLMERPSQSLHNCVSM